VGSCPGARPDYGVRGKNVVSTGGRDERTAARTNPERAIPVQGDRAGRASPGRKSKGWRRLPRGHRVAVLIACKNGAETIANSVASAIEQADVYVVSDGSTDETADVARAAGASVLERETSGGKPDALRSGNLAFELASSYEYIAILDDDTTLEPGYLWKLTTKLDADETIAAASGRIESVWEHGRRWNALIAMRAFMYWSYQTTLKRGQNALRVVNVICGANTVFRAAVFGTLIDDDAPYAIDDMYWLAEIVRRKLGRVAFVYDARSSTIDPHRFGDWYRQTVRWSWGQFQSVRGHRLGVPVQRDAGRRHGWAFSWFDTAYLALLIDWFAYAVEPLAVVPLAWWLGRWFDPLWFVVFYLGSSIGWIAVAACALRKPRLLVLAPAILVLDLLYRLTMVHAVIKTIRQPRIETCRWDSPERFRVENNQSA
jgi:poly-beta-1,6-N-acetyl-D-glucosamine synthase